MPFNPYGLFAKHVTSSVTLGYRTIQYIHVNRSERFERTKLLESITCCFVDRTRFLEVYTCQFFVESRKNTQLNTIGTKMKFPNITYIL